jgi:hypothetical protein
MFQQKSINHVGLVQQKQMNKIAIQHLCSVLHSFKSDTGTGLIIVPSMALLTALHAAKYSASSKTQIMGQLFFYYL